MEWEKVARTVINRFLPTPAEAKARSDIFRILIDESYGRKLLKKNQKLLKCYRRMERQDVFARMFHTDEVDGAAMMMLWELAQTMRPDDEPVGYHV